MSSLASRDEASERHDAHRVGILPIEQVADQRRALGALPSVSRQARPKWPPKSSKTR
jgi:hypothetical protein